MYPAGLFGLQPPRVVRLARFVVPTLIALGFAAPAARAQTVDPNTWGADGQVYAIATNGNTIYLGGSFGIVGSNTGHFAQLDLGNGAAAPENPSCR